jgi:hypothetical protein
MGDGEQAIFLKSAPPAAGGAFAASPWSPTGLGDR